MWNTCRFVLPSYLPEVHKFSCPTLPNRFQMSSLPDKSEYKTHIDSSSQEPKDTNEIKPNISTQHQKTCLMR